MSVLSDNETSYSHRIYLDAGIWAEVTLIYRKDSYHPLSSGHIPTMLHRSSS